MRKTMLISHTFPHVRVLFTDRATIAFDGNVIDWRDRACDMNAYATANPAYEWDTLSIGDDVSHETYGIGTVTNITERPLRVHVKWDVTQRMTPVNVDTLKGIDWS